MLGEMMGSTRTKVSRSTSVHACIDETIPVTKGSVHATRNQALAALVETRAMSKAENAEFNMTEEREEAVAG